MTIYTYPDGVVDNLQVKGLGLFDASVYFTGHVQAATAALLDGTIHIGSASGDTIAFYKGVGATQAATLSAVGTSTETLIGATQNYIILQAIIDLMESVGLSAT